MNTFARLVSVAFAVMSMALPAARADTIKIGMLADMTGPDGKPYPAPEDLNGAKLAVEDINKAGGVLGRSIELIIEDLNEVGGRQAMQANAVAAFDKLAAQPNIVAFVGPDFSLLIHAMAADVMKAGKPMMIGGQDPKLTHMGNQWLFRARPNDTYSTRVVATLGVTELQRKNWALLHVNDPYGNSAKDGLKRELKQLGVEPVLVQGIDHDENAPSNLMRFVQAAKDAKADVVVSYLQGAGMAASPVLLARLLRQNDVGVTWIGSPTLTGTEILQLAGADLDGAYAVTDFVAAASPEAGAYAQRYQAVYNAAADQWSAWVFDAVKLLAKAITAAGGTAPDKLRAAILGIRDYKGAEGTYNFDANGDGLHGYNIVHNEHGSWVFQKHVDFDLPE